MNGLDIRTDRHARLVESLKPTDSFLFFFFLIFTSSTNLPFLCLYHEEVSTLCILLSI